MNASAVQGLLFASCGALLGGCLVVPYLLGVPPRSRRDWRILTATLTFIIWLLAGFIFLRAA